MNGRKQQGITVLELLVTVAIVAILAALTIPAIRASKKSALATTCVSNLKQLFYAIETYRSDSESDPIGTPSQMGLPPFKMLSAISRPFQCREINPVSCAGLNAYDVNWPVVEFSNPGEDQEWIERVARRGNSIILLSDFGHSSQCPITSASLNKGIGLTLGGEVKNRLRRADPSLIDAFFD